MQPQLSYLPRLIVIAVVISLDLFGLLTHVIASKPAFHMKSEDDVDVDQLVEVVHEEDCPYVAQPDPGVLRVKVESARQRDVQFVCEEQAPTVVISLSASPDLRIQVSQVNNKKEKNIRHPGTRPERMHPRRSVHRRSHRP